MGRNQPLTSAVHATLDLNAVPRNRFNPTNRFDCNAPMLCFVEHLFPLQPTRYFHCRAEENRVHIFLTFDSATGCTRGMYDLGKSPSERRNQFTDTIANINVRCAERHSIAMLLVNRTIGVDQSCKQFKSLRNRSSQINFRDILLTRPVSLAQSDLLQIIPKPVEHIPLATYLGIRASDSITSTHYFVDKANVCIANRHGRCTC